MRINRSRYIVAVVSLLVFLLTGQAGVQGYVLCLGEDGHAALEYTAGNRCAGAADMGRRCHEGAHDLSPEENCGPCLDVPSGLDFTSRRHFDQDNLAAAPIITAPRILPPSVLFRVLSSPLRPESSPRISQTLLAHRTVVLLN